MESRLNHWNERWSAGRTGWHSVDIHPSIVKYGPEFLTNEDAPKRCFIPLCGKTLVLKHLYEKGHSVVGVEGVEKAVNDFFEENKIAFTKRKGTTATIYETEDKRLQIYMCDLFDIEKENLGTFDFIFDRGSLVAIYLEDRDRYGKLINNMFAPKCFYLLSTLFYDGIETKSGSPRCVTEDQIIHLYGSVWDIDHREVIPIDKEKSRMFGYEEMFERFSILRPK